MELRPDTLDSSALIQGCLKRPAEEAVWEEFVRRYHPTILATVSIVHSSKTRRQRVAAQCADEITDDLVQTVYRRLIEHRSQALKEITGKCSESIHHYLAMVSVNVVRNYFANRV